MPHSPSKPGASKQYADGWRAVNELIRADGSWSGRERNTCYRNLGGGKFADVSFVSGLDFDGDGRAWIATDYDHDGDIDLIVKFRNEPQLRVLRNEANSPGRALLLELNATGARATVRTNQRSMLRESGTGSGYLSQHSPRLHFGLREGEQIEEVTVRWPDGKVQRAAVSEPGFWRVNAGGAERLNLPLPQAAPAPKPEAEPATGTWLLEPLPAPEFSLKTLDGRQVTLTGLKGKPVLLSFWATYCPPCRGELADLRDRAAAFRAAGVQVVTVNVDEPGSDAVVQKYVTELRVRFPVLMATERMTAVYSLVHRYLFDRRRDLGIPTSFLIGSDGRIVKVYTGAAPAETMLADAKALKGPSIPFPGRWLNEPNGRNYLDLGTALAERGFAAEAREVFEYAVRQGHGGPVLQTNLGTLLLEAGEMEKAQKLLESSLGANPEARINLALLHLRGGRTGEALNLLNEAIRTYPDDAALWHAAGTAHSRKGQTGEALRHFRRAVELQPEDAEYRFALGSALAGTEPSEAISHLEAARKLGRGGADLGNTLGILYMESGRTEQARQAFTQAAAAAPGDYGTLVNLAMFHLRAGEPRESLEWARKAGVTRPEAALMAAQAHMAVGQTAEARKVLSGHRDHPDARELLRRLSGAKD